MKLIYPVQSCRFACNIWCRQAVGKYVEIDILLPEIQVDNFERSRLQFEFVAKAKQWDEAKQLEILPTILCGKLLDHYVGLSADVKKDRLDETSIG